MAKRVVGGVVVDLIARTKKWDKGFKDAKKNLISFESALSDTAKKVAAFAAGVFAIRRMNEQFREQSRVIDSVAKTSDKLNIATERLVEMQHAAELTGVPVTALNVGLQRMTRRLATAATVGGSTADALKDLKLQAKGLASLSPDEQFLKIADAMEAVEDQGQRVRLTFALFDTEGVNLVNTMRGGSSQLKQLFADAQTLGLTFTRAQAARVEAARDAFKRLRSVSDGVVRQFVIALAPVMKVVTDQMVKWATSTTFAKDVLREVVPVVESVASAVMFMGDVVTTLKGMWQGLKATANAFGAGVLMATEFAIRGLADMGVTLDHLRAAWLGLKVIALEGLWAIQKTTGETTNGIKLAAVETEVAITEARLQMERLLDGSQIAGESTATTMRDVADSVGELADSLNENAQDAAVNAAAAWDELVSSDRRDKMKSFFADLKAAQLDVGKTAAETAATVTQVTATQLKKQQEMQQSNVDFIMKGLRGIADASEASARTQFEVNKIFALADIFINTRRAIMAYSGQGRPGMAIAAGVLGGIQAAAVAATTFTGGVTAGPSGDAAAAAPAAAAADAGPAQPTQQFNFTFTGPEDAPVPRQQVLRMLEGMAEAVGDGAPTTFVVRNA
jgi:hypothetical protein